MTMKTSVPVLGKGNGFIAPVSGWETWRKITGKTYSTIGLMNYPRIKETFNIRVEDADDAVKLYILVRTLLAGPEMEMEIVKATPERAIVRCTKCAWWERYKELGFSAELTVCDAGHQAYTEVGFSVINPKLTYNLTKAMPRGDSYCESIIEFKKNKS